VKKYEPLGKFPVDMPASTDRVTLSFSEIERIIGADLPPAAFRHRAWWANRQGGHGRHTGGQPDSRLMASINRIARFPFAGC